MASYVRGWRHNMPIFSSFSSQGLKSYNRQDCLHHRAVLDCNAFWNLQEESVNLTGTFTIFADREESEVDA